MVSVLYFRLHNCSYYGSASAALPTGAAMKALSSQILRVSPLVALRCRSLCVVPSAKPELEQHHHHHLQEQRHLRSPELVALEYADLNLSYKLDLGHVRIRQHVNPLSPFFSVPARAPDWNQTFKDPTLPLMVDIGCGSGRFLLWLAKRNPEVRNFLGLEIRQKLVKRAEVWAKDLALDNIHFLFANATISFKQVLASYPGPLMLVSILCPDPHLKRRHHKRRVLQNPLVCDIVDTLMPGGQVLVQSDVLEVALDMRNQFDEVDSLKHIDTLNPTMSCDSQGWLLCNPMGIRTEREIHADLEGAKIYRRMYQKQI